MASDKELTRKGCSANQAWAQSTGLPDTLETPFAFLLELLVELQGRLALPSALCCGPCHLVGVQRNVCVTSEKAGEMVLLTPRLVSSCTQS